MSRIGRFLLLASTLGLVACADYPTASTEAPVVETEDPSPGAFGPATLAFVSTRDGAPYIYYADADGRVARVTPGSSPAWSWDGRRIAFVHRNRIHAMDADGSNVRALGAGKLPTWSPDGRIAFVRSRDGSHSLGLYVMNGDGTGVEELLGDAWLCSVSSECEAGYILYPTWSPDGRTIAFHVWVGSTLRGVGMVDGDGSDPRLVEELMHLGAGFSQGVNTRAAWSPDGSSIAVITGNPWLLATSPYVIYRYHVAWGLLEEVHSAPGLGVGGAPNEPDWSPDGNRILFDASVREGDPRVHRRIFTVSPEGGAVLQLIPDVADAGGPYRDYGAVWSRAVR